MPCNHAVHKNNKKLTKISTSPQFDFQAILATDGKISFAIFLYGDLLKLIIEDFPREIGFDAGDRKLGGIFLLQLSDSDMINGSLFHDPEPGRNFRRVGLIFRTDGTHICACAWYHMQVLHKASS